MFDWLRKGIARKRANVGFVDDLYGSIADAARHPALYTRYGVADTLMGRYEMMALHTFLFQHRAKGASPALEAMAQDVVDTHFRELDHSLREVGIGDAAVPKRMKKLGRMVYGRWEAYGAAIDKRDAGELAEAFRRNVYAEGGDAACAPDLAAYAFAAAEALHAQGDDDLLSGRIAFPQPGSVVESV